MTADVANTQLLASCMPFLRMQDANSLKAQPLLSTYLYDYSDCVHAISAKLL